ncbi:PAS domain S-box protein [Desulfosporosinus fructosivorans]|nr:HD domain-containing phosphohydrolase [Desulfosporosinus fructosivorans]
MILGTYRVISKYKFLRLPEQFLFEEVVKEIMDMVILLNDHGKIIKVSKHTLNILKFEEHELLKQDVGFIIDDNYKEEFSLCKMIGNNANYKDINILTKQGEKIPVDISCKPICDELYDLLGVIIVIQDISLMHDLRRKNEELQAYIQRVTEAQAELRFQYNQNVKSEKKLSISEEKFRTMFEQAPLGITLCDSLTGRFYEMNSKFAEIVGRATEEITNIDWMSISHPDDIQENIKRKSIFKDSILKGFNMNKRYIKPNGSVVWANITVANLRLEYQGNPSEICMIEDITEQKINEDALKASEYTFRKLFEGSSDAILIMEAHRVIDCNPAAIELLGYGSKNRIVGKTSWELSPENQPDGILSLEKALNINLKAIEKGKYRFEWWHKKENGLEFPVEIMLTSILVKGKQVLHALLRDVSERKLLEQKLEYLSYNDVLTGLYNRRFFEEELKRLNVQRNLPLTLVMADVNGLKLINDSFGHAIGDELLKKVGDVIVGGCRSDDIIARLGGDEFVILLPNTDAFETEQIVKRIKANALNEKVGSIEISISFGWESKLHEEQDIHEIFKKAEDHMYKKKLFESPSMRGKTINAIINTLHEKNKREEQHSHRVSALCKSIGKALGLSAGEIEELKTVGLLHDIGKIAVEETTLNKQGELTEDEWQEIKRHPEIGYRILNTVNDMAEIAEYILCHHERWDGFGYPKGLKGGDIPIQARIIAIADAYDAMTSERSYRSAMPEKIAIEELQKNSGIQFDPKIVRVFIETVLK